MKIPLGTELARALGTESSCGLMIAVLATGAAIAVYFGVKGGTLGWIAGALGAVGTVLAIVKGWAELPHTIRATRLYVRRTRLTKRFTKATEGLDAGAGDARRAEVFRRSIVEGSLTLAAAAVVSLFLELAGDDAFAEEVANECGPVWPATLYLKAAVAKDEDDQARAHDLLEQALATNHPVWATAAAVAILEQLDEVGDREHVTVLRDWIKAHGDPAVVTELVLYDHHP